MTHTKEIQLLTLLLARLERISADSVCAHRASGLRGTLIRMQEELENGETVSGSWLEALKSAGFQILEASAKEKH